MTADDKAPTDGEDRRKDGRGSTMRLGSSLRRRRPGRGRRGDLPPWLEGPVGRFVLTAGLLTLAGLGIGYLFATRVVFPAPPPPGDLQTVPDVRGLDAAAASERILDAELVPGESRGVRHPEADSGSVVAQDPLPGQLARPESPVNLTLSLGPERSTVPDVVGLRREWAVNLLQAAGFVVEADSVEDDEARGVVVEVDPEPGTELNVPADVRVSVSTGPPVVAMPSVLGMTEEEALDTLRALGFQVTEVDEVFRFGRDRGRVVEQVPAADSLLPPGSRVRLSVGRR